MYMPYQPSFHWLLYWRYVIWELFQHKSVFYIFCISGKKNSHQGFFWFFFCFSFWKGHSLDLEMVRKFIQWVKDHKKACDLILMRFHRLIFMRWRQKAKTADANGVNVFLRKVMNKARFKCRSTHLPNVTDELSTAKERRLNQFGTAVLVWCGKSVKFDRVCRTFVQLNLGSTHGTPSESDVAPVWLQSRTYSVRFGTWKVRRLNQA